MQDVTPPSDKPQETNLPSSSYKRLAQSLWHDPIVLGAFLAAALVTGFQIALVILSPPWSGPASQWLLTVLAWLGFAGLLLVARWASQKRAPAALSWWLCSAALFAYAIGWALRLVGTQVLFGGLVPFPWWSDLFWLLQYPFFFLALLVAPTVAEPLPPGLARLKLLLDFLLLMGAATLLSWYFLLTPIYLESEQPLVGKLINLAYPVGDLVVLFLLSVLFLRARSLQATRIVLGLAAVGLLLLIVGDSWYAWLNLHGIYQPGSGPGIFWCLGYLLFPLAGLVAIRLNSYVATISPEVQTALANPRIQPQELVEALRFLLPFIAALLASVITLSEILLGSGGNPRVFLPLIVSLGLLALTIVRQGVVFLELMRLRRERETARANERAMREVARQMDNFLNIASHELRTPLTTTTLQLQMAQRNLRQWTQQGTPQPPATAHMLQGLQINLAQTEDKLRRLNRLASDLLDTSRIQAERLTLHLERVNLLSIVVSTVEEQRHLSPERTITLHLPAEHALPIMADPGRISQVITNYLTNALKYSPENCPVEVVAQREEQQARVWVRDQGPGILPEEQERIWQRFHRAKGVEVQNGSAIGLGLGLFLSKMIVEEHEGQVGVQSTPGQGATFWFTLPLAPPEEEAAHL